MAASERLFELLDTHTEVREQPAAVALPPFQRAIEFVDVGFGYEDGQGRHALRGVTFTVRAGQMVAIVGRSGAGRRRSSTCCRASTTSPAAASSSTDATSVT